ncbi:MAG: rod shape-determining protein MreD [Nitrospirae bacterium]|nr:rod shape-determining protein MreD [Nitrospirota bacterium]
MRTFIIYILLAYIALAVQSVFFHGVKPDLAFVLVCFYAVRHGQLKGVTYGALTGLLIDTAGGFILGPNVISKALTAYLISAVKENLFQWNRFISTVMISIFSLLNILSVYVCLETFSKVSYAGRPWSIPIIEVVYTTAAAAVLFPLFKSKRSRRYSDFL